MKLLEADPYHRYEIAYKYVTNKHDLFSLGVTKHSNVQSELGFTSQSGDQNFLGIMLYHHQLICR